VEQGFRGDLIDNYIEGQAKSPAAGLLRQPREGEARVSGAQSRIQALVVADPEQIARCPREKRRRDADRVEPHCGDPIKLTAPHVDLSRKQRVEVIDAGFRHGERCVAALNDKHGRNAPPTRRYPFIDGLAMASVPINPAAGLVGRPRRNPKARRTHPRRVMILAVDDTFAHPGRGAPIAGPRRNGYRPLKAAIDVIRSAAVRELLTRIGPIAALLPW
jgi:hypothetical protein